MVKTRIVASVDLNEDIKKIFLNTLFATKDSNAHQVDVQLHRDGEPVQLDGAGVSGYFIRYSDNASVLLDGTATGNTASVTLKQSCYNKAGQFAIVIKVTTGDEISTVFYGEGSMCVGGTDTIVDDENIIHTLDELLAEIDNMRTATAEATAATEEAKEATTLLETEAQKHLDAMQDNHDTLSASLESQGGDIITAINDVWLDCAEKLKNEGNTQVAQVETATEDYLATQKAITVTGVDTDGAEHTWTIYGVVTS